MDVKCWTGHEHCTENYGGKYSHFGSRRRWEDLKAEEFVFIIFRYILVM
jgi:hypothetical protein